MAHGARCTLTKHLWHFLLAALLNVTLRPRCICSESGSGEYVSLYTTSFESSSRKVIKTYNGNAVTQGIQVAVANVTNDAWREGSGFESVTQADNTNRDSATLRWAAFSHRIDSADTNSGVTTLPTTDRSSPVASTGSYSTAVMRSNFGIGWSSWKSLTEGTGDRDIEPFRHSSTTTDYASSIDLGGITATTATDSFNAWTTDNSSALKIEDCQKKRCAIGATCVDTSDGSKCVTQCDMHPGYCLNSGICSITNDGKMACWCPSSSKWWFRGDRCEVAESIAKISVIAGGCGVVALVIILLLVIRMAKLSVKAKQKGTRSPYHNKAFGFPKSSFTQQNSIPMRNIARSVSTHCDTDSGIAPPRRATSFVHYSQLGTITREGEARTNFNSSDLMELGTVRGLTTGANGRINTQHSSFSVSSSTKEPTIVEHGSRYETTGMIL